MDASFCDINHLDADVLLPPRKRLLAGFKKQSPDGNGQSSEGNGQSSDGNGQISDCNGLSSDGNAASHTPLTALSLVPPSTSFPVGFYTNIDILLNHRLNNLNLSPEELVEASKSAAAAADKAAKDARAAAEDKAAIAAKAVAVAKSALELVSSFNEEAASKERCLKKNKLKKHVPVQLLYKNNKPVENCRADEDLARRLHRAINSSPRISKNSSSSGVKSHKNKKLKNLPISEKIGVSNGSLILRGNSTSTPTVDKTWVSNGNAVAGDLDSEGSIREIYTVKANDKVSKYEKNGHLEMDDGEADSRHSKEKGWEDMSPPGKRRGRVKLKKLPLSICSIRDQVNPKEETMIRSSSLTEKNKGIHTARSKPLFSLESSPDGVMPIEATTVWKCQEIKAAACVKQNKVMQS
ncbi:hypothetical protein CFOL_v3_25011 [Cephalotus follicularis]|uniref:Uncharacterized protein n=1 Tax=Cephalotus follicularis TaxID=3775 RepID=A0A1Q3CMT8_CEPFO|nr:hypothetical protein CFOL_v3_25011 [Cephalotus follicularis]